MLDTLLIFIGAGLGGVLRYWTSNLSHGFLGHEFPYGTLVVNISGCFLMGILFILLFEKFDGISPHLRTLLLVGFLGGYTTFSSFSIETITLFENGAFLSAALNIVLSLALCLSATCLGAFIGKQFIV